MFPRKTVRAGRLSVATGAVTYRRRSPSPTVRASDQGGGEAAGPGVVSRTSTEKFGDRLAGVDHLDRATPGGRVLGGEVDAHRLGHRGDEVHDADGSVGDVDAVLIGGADDRTSLHSAPSHDHRPAS